MTMGDKLSDGEGCEDACVFCEAYTSSKRNIGCLENQSGILMVKMVQKT